MTKNPDKMKQSASPDDQKMIAYRNADDMLSSLKKEIEKRWEKSPEKIEEYAHRIEQLEFSISENLSQEERERTIEITQTQLDDIIEKWSFDDIMIQFKRGKRSIVEETKEWLGKARTMLEKGKGFAKWVAEEVQEVKEKGITEALKWAKTKFLWALGLSGGLAGLGASLGKSLRNHIFMSIKIWFYKVLDFIDVFDWFDFKKNIETLQKQKEAMLLAEAEEDKKKEEEDKKKEDENKESTADDEEDKNPEKGASETEDEEKKEEDDETEESVEYIITNPREALTQTTKKIATISPLFDHVIDPLIEEDRELSAKEKWLFEDLKSGRLSGLSHEDISSMGEKYWLAGLALSGSIKVFQSLEWSDLLEKFPKKEKDQKTWWEKAFENANITSEEKVELTQIFINKKNPEKMYDMDSLKQERLRDKFDPIVEPVKNTVKEIKLDLDTNPLLTTTGAALFGTKFLGFTGALKTAKISYWLIHSGIHLGCFWFGLGGLLGVLSYYWAKKALNMPVPKDTSEFRSFVSKNIWKINEHLAEKGVERSLTYEEIDAGLRGLEDKNILEKMLSEAKNFFVNLAEKAVEMTELSKEEMETIKTNHNIRHMRDTLALSAKNDPSLHLSKPLLTLDIILNERLSQQEGKNHLPFSQREFDSLQKACENSNCVLENENWYIKYQIKKENIILEEWFIGINPNEPEWLARDNLIRTLRTKNNWWSPFEVTGQAIRNELHEIKPLLAEIPLVWFLFDEIENTGKVSEETVSDFIKDGWTLFEVAGRYFLRYGKHAVELPQNAWHLIVQSCVDSENIGAHISQFACEYGNAAATGLVIWLPGVIDAFLTKWSFLWAARQIIGHTIWIPVKMVKNTAKIGFKTLYHGWWKGAKWTFKNTPGILSGKTSIIEKLWEVARHKLWEWIESIHLRYDLWRWFIPSSSSATAELRQWLRNTIKARELAKYLEEHKYSASSRADYLDDLQAALEKSSKDGRLKTKFPELFNADWSRKTFSLSRESLKKIIERLDDEVNLSRAEIVQESRIGKFIQWMKNSKGGKWSADKIDDIMSNLKSRKMLQALPKIIEVAGMAGAAYFAYDLYTTKEPEKMVAQHTTFWWVQILTSALLGKKVGPFSKMIVSFGVTIFGDSFLGSSQYVESILWQIMWAEEFNPAIARSLSETLSAGMSLYTVRNILRKAWVRAAIEWWFDASIGILGKTLVILWQKVRTKLIQKMIKSITIKLAVAWARAGSVSWVPGLNVAMWIWTGVEAYQLYQMWDKANKVNDMFDKQNKKKITKIWGMNEKTTRNFADLYKMEKSVGGIIADFNSIPEEEKNAYIAEVIADENKMTQIAYCNLTISRDDGSSEEMVFEQWHPKFIKIKANDEEVELNEKDLESAEKWEAPKDYKVDDLTELYKKCDEQGAEGNTIAMFTYVTLALSLKNKAKWSQADIEPKSSREVLVQRHDSTLPPIIMRRGLDNFWKLETSNNTVLATGLTFQASFALANLNLGLVWLVEKKVKTDGDTDWQSENATTVPFQFDGEELEYAKDGAMDINMLEDGEWLNFYKRNLAIEKSTLTGSLNAYFWSVAKERWLLGNP